MDTIHVVVAAGEWNQDRLRYRRHRLAQFLKGEPDTQEVIWLCPSPQKHDLKVTQLANGVQEWTVQDIMPQKIFRFGRYIDLFYRGKLRTLLAHLRLYKDHCRFFLWYTFPGFPELINGFPWDKIIYDCSDLWASPIGGGSSFVSRLRQRIIAGAERKIINGADIIFCTSDDLRKRVIQLAGEKRADHVHTFENGVEFQLFTKKDRAEGVIPDNFSDTVVGYIGGIKPKLDFELIRKAAIEKREWLFLFVGPDGTGKDSDFQQLSHEQNVLWTGSVSPEKVPEYMNLIDIGIMPYKQSPYNGAVFPLKLFEFLAAGKPVIGLNLPSTQKYAREGVYDHLETNDPDVFVHACEQMARVETDENYTQERVQLARQKDWNGIFQRMIDLIH